MTQTAEGKEIKKLEEMLKQMKFGDMFKPSQFKNAEEAQKFIEEFQKKLPRVGEEELKDLNMIVDKANEVVAYAEKEANDESCKYYGLKPIAESFNYFVPNFVSSCVDENGKSLYPEYDEAHKKRYERPGGDRADPLDPPMSKEIQDLCYPFMKEWRQKAMQGANHDEIMAIKTPYEKLPFKTRFTYKLKKALHLKTDPEVKKLDDISWALSKDRDSGMDHGWNYRCWRDNEASNAYLQDLLSLPYDKMVEKMNKDLPVLDDDSHYLEKHAKDIKEAAKEHIENRDRALKINALCSEIVETMENKSKRFFKVREHAHGARVSLAQKGMLPNEEVKEPAVSGVVANDRVVAAKKQGNKLDWAEAKKRKTGKDSR